MFIMAPYRFATGVNDPHYASVSHLLHFEGADATTTFTDQKGATWSVAGNAQIDTAQFKYGASSGLFDGSGDYIETAGTLSNTLSSSDFTLEAWIKPVLTGDRCIAAKRASGTAGWALEARSTGAIWLRANINSTYSDTRITTATGLITSNTNWHHVALTRNGTAWTIWVDGNSAGTLTSSGGFNDAGGQVLRIGRAANLGEDEYSGWIDEFRLTKGVARYTSNFTPPSVAFPDS